MKRNKNIDCGYDWPKGIRNANKIFLQGFFLVGLLNGFNHCGWKASSFWRRDVYLTDKRWGRWWNAPTNTCLPPNTILRGKLL